MAYIGTQPLTGKYAKLDALTFDGTTTTFNLTSGGQPVYPQLATNLVISVNGVLQEPTVGYNTSGQQIIFSEAPSTGQQFFGTLLGQVLNVWEGIPSDGQVTGAKLAPGAVTQNLGFTPMSSVADGSITATKLQDTAITDKLGFTPMSGIADGSITATKLQNTAITDKLGFTPLGNNSPQNITVSQTNPSLQLRNTNTGNSFEILDKTSAVQCFVVDNIGNLSIGPLGSQALGLHISKTQGNQQGLQVTSGAAYATISIADTGDFRISNASQQLPTVFYTNNTERMRIDSSGNVKLTTGSLQQVKTALAANDINLNTGNFFTKTISGNTTFTVSNTPTTGTTTSFILELTNPGSATITWWSGVKWAGGTAPTLTASGVDILGFYTHDGGTTWRGLVLAKDSK